MALMKFLLKGTMENVMRNNNNILLCYIPEYKTAKAYKYCKFTSV